MPGRSSEPGFGCRGIGDAVSAGEAVAGDSEHSLRFAEAEVGGDGGCGTAGCGR